MKRRQLINETQFLLGISALLFGALEYLIHRSAHASRLGSFLHETVGPRPVEVNLFGPLAGTAPEFFHPLAFCLLTLSLIPEATRRVRVWTCLGWLAIELFFEIGQHVAGQWARDLIGSDIAEPFSAVATYFSQGTYDPFDVLAIFLGISAAYILSKMTGFQRFELKEV